MKPAYTLSVATPATLFPLTLDEVKSYLRVVDAAEDAVVEQCYRAAIEQAQQAQDRTFLTTTYTMKLDTFPESDTILLPTSPLQSVTSITYLDYAGSSQTLATTVYAVDTSREPPRITLKYAQSWPGTYGQANDVTITFVAGYTAAANVPYSAKVLIMQIAGALYENRVKEPRAQEASDNVFPDGLAASGRVWTVA